MSKINKNAVIRYIVPFYFESSSYITDASDEYRVLSNNLSYDNSRWEAVVWEETERDTFEYLYRSLYYKSDECHIGSRWHYNLSDNPMNFRYYPSSDEPETCYDFHMKDMGLYLFRTNVGILWYEISLPRASDDKNGDSVDSSFLIRFQNRFKELNLRRQKCFRQISANQEESVLIMGDIIHEILQDISENIHYLNGSRKNDENIERPDKALIFNYALLEDENLPEEKLRETAFLLANGYNENYHMPPDIKETMINAFANTCWYATRGGCGYFSSMNPGEKNMFFLHTLPGRIRGDYFFMYILALYQSYSILNYLRRIMQYYPADSQKYFELEKGGQLNEFTSEINTFLMKGMYSSVSNIHHQNMFFQYLQKQLSIKEDIESITMGVNALAKMQRLHYEKENALLKEKRELRSKKRDNQLSLILAVLSVLSVFSALMDIHSFVNMVQSICGDQSYLQKLWSLLTSGDSLIYFQIIMGLAVICLSVASVSVIVINMLDQRPKKKQKKDRND